MSDTEKPANPNVAKRTVKALWSVASGEVFRRNHALATEVAALREQVATLEKQSTTDTLTELPNRRALDHALPRMAHDAQREGKVLVIAFIDADHFKKVNDTLGHDVGDLVLKHIARTASNSVRDTDMIARYGGEEFILVAKCDHPRHGLMLADKVRKNIEAMPCPLPNGAQVPVTISSGVAIVDKHTNIQTAIKQADQAVYVAKSLDRNCVVYNPGNGDLPVRVLESSWDKQHIVMANDLQPTTPVVAPTTSAVLKPAQG